MVFVPLGHGLSPPGSSVHEIFQVRILGVGGHFLLQGIFLTQGLQVSSLPLMPPGKTLAAVDHETIGYFKEHILGMEGTGQ